MREEEKIITDEEGDNNQEIPKEFVIISQSPYYLHPFDGPRAVIIFAKFDGKNYDLWEQAVKNALKSKNELDLMDGSVQKLTQCSAKLNAWEMVNPMITHGF